MSGITIARLADSPATLPTLQSWFESEWRSYYGPAGPGNAAADLRQACNRAVLPIGLVAFIDEEPCGTAALRATSIESHRHLGPWITGLLVGSRFRRRGVGGSLIDAVEALAAERGHPLLYCATATARGLLERRGWHRLPGGTDGTVVYVKGLGA